MANFSKSIDLVIRHEGIHFVNDPHDPGGATKYGISLKFYKTIKPEATESDISGMTLEQAQKIYFDNFWLKNNYNTITNDDIACRVFDLSVNIGSYVANKCIQEATNKVCGTNLILDGILGSASINALNVNLLKSMAILTHFRLNALNYYRNLVAANPNLDIYMRGWFARLYDK